MASCNQHRKFVAVWCVVFKIYVSGQTDIGIFKIKHHLN